MPLNHGQTFIQGRSAELARQLLDAAAELGYDPVTAVRTTSRGYVVPDDVADRLTAPSADEAF